MRLFSGLLTVMALGIAAPAFAADVLIIGDSLSVGRVRRSFSG